MPDPTVTVAMAVYNGGAALSLAVQSIVDQSFQDWELILVDDGSTDDTVNALRRTADPRIRIISDGTNKGLAARLNQIVDLASGRFLARMDHDDIAHPDRLAQQVAFLTDHPEVDLLGTRCMSMSEEERIVGELPFAETHVEICRRPWLGFYLAHPSWMGRTSWFRRNPYADPAPYCCEDQELLLRAHGTSHYHALPQALLAYRIRARVPLVKLFRTRAALVLVQMRRLAFERRYGSCVLATMAFVARTVSDILRQISPSRRPDIRSVHDEARDAWQRTILSLRERAGVPRAS